MNEQPELFHMPSDQSLDAKDDGVGQFVSRARRAATLATLVGEAPAFVRAITNLATFAASSETVLIEGETGTGKELAARALHYLSDRAPFAFIPVNCAAIPDSLLEDELFGHESGAFTGAEKKRCGIVAEAEKGTLFLDEIDALSPRGQGALLRVIQERRYRPVGSTGERCANVRFVVATNSKLEQHVSSGRFRADFFYRIAVFQVRMPPLRERPQDILRLTNHFVAKHAQGRQVQVTHQALLAMMQFEWPGNVRQLENAVIRGCHLCRGGAIHPDDLGLQSPGGIGVRKIIPVESLEVEPMQFAKQRAVREFEQQYLANVMSISRGNITKAASIAGKERREFGKLLKKHSIDSGQFLQAMPLVSQAE